MFPVISFYVNILHYNIYLTFKNVQIGERSECLLVMMQRQNVKRERKEDAESERASIGRAPCSSATGSETLQGGLHVVCM